MIKQLSEVLILQRGMNINFKSVTCHIEDSSLTASDIAFMLTIIIPKLRLGFFFFKVGYADSSFSHKKPRFDIYLS